MTTADEIQLRFPGRLEYVRLTRLVASGLATKASFTLDETEDVRIAVDELCATVIDHSDEGAEVTAVFTVHGSTMSLTVSAAASDTDVELDELSEHILRATVDEHEVVLEDGRIVARMEKACATPDS